MILWVWTESLTAEAPGLHGLAIVVWPLLLQLIEQQFDRLPHAGEQAMEQIQREEREEQGRPELDELRSIVERALAEAHIGAEGSLEPKSGSCLPDSGSRRI
jgi:hypothetical protein